MLNSISSHLADEEEQQRLDLKLAQQIEKLRKINLNAFQRYIPSLIDSLENSKSRELSLFINKFEQVNIVNVGTGRPLYGLHPDEEIAKHVALFLRDMRPQGFSESDVVCDADTKKVDLLVIMGIGLGQHIYALLEEMTPSIVIIYEPEYQYFGCSFLGNNWREILDFAYKNQIKIFFQLGKDGRDIISDIEKLKSQFGISSYSIYKHYNHPVFDSITKQFTHLSYEKLKKTGFSTLHQSYVEDAITRWMPPNDKSEYSEVDKNKRFEKSLKAFKKYFPEIHAEFKEYVPQKWFPVVGTNGEINVFNAKNNVFLYSDSPVEDCNLSYQQFCKNPNKDGLVLAYEGEKLKHYEHYKFLKSTQALLDSDEEGEAALPKGSIKAIIVFGVGVGYQIEKLILGRDVQNIFICEPNRDFFYCSLFSIDWSKILKSVDKKKFRMYINIGDDGTHLFRDLLSQFYSIGPYILSETFFFQTYYNAKLTDAIRQLREQLQVVISMGEYFDHARYGIAHTLKSLAACTPYLRNNAERYLTQVQKETPVFIVGNGPSLDYTIEALLEYKDRAIIVSCGTALDALYRAGIKPDFHAEIEQNRSTFDWVSRVGDFDFLKSLSVISCNGLHPDTMGLFNDVYLSFKEGESSTVSTLNVLGDQTFHTLKYAFPTVSNFAFNLFCQLGFSEIYLFGVDLGFREESYHHSKNSGYYSSSGDPIYDYSQASNNAIKAVGNFGGELYTKYEFKVSKEIIEQSIKNYSLDCYNVSDGVKIRGATPLRDENLLILCSEEQKIDTVAAIKEQAYQRVDGEAFKRKFDGKYSGEVICQEIEGLIVNAQKASDYEISLDQLVEENKRKIFSSYERGNSLLFYYLYGTTNYANVILTRLARKEKDVTSPGNLKTVREEILTEWRNTLGKIRYLVTERQYELESSTAFSGKSIYSILRYKLHEKTLNVVSSHSDFNDAMRTIVSLNTPGVNVTFHDPQRGHSLKAALISGPTIVYSGDAVTYLSENRHVFSELEAQGGFPCIIIEPSPLNKAEVTNVPRKATIFCCYLGASGNESVLEDNWLDIATFSYFYSLETLSFDILLMKYTFSDAVQNRSFELVNSQKREDIYDCGWCIGLSQGKQSSHSDYLLENGLRIKTFEDDKSVDSYLVKSILPEQEFQERKKKQMERYSNYINGIRNV
ncbi:6-hydroxymethylpterin diphosphokinase MptE-like protein [Aestuariibacter salexigens]|uniref:6-hydroxymethylpterin diphosphokinase MptE-like protein n=1 Tax=Aestuariibacter salexigens TaxID=226010 RepID=UPI00040145B4|nr:6-hydroxymethylpterin diphosphokinase MptE-like protein [Aestuariibacter salexigens]